MAKINLCVLIFSIAVLTAILLPAPLRAAICQGGDCDRDDNEEVQQQEQPVDAPLPTAKPTRKARAMPWGQKPPQNCNQCINYVLQTCNKECKGGPLADQLTCRQICAEKYCSSFCLG